MNFNYILLVLNRICDKLLGNMHYISIIVSFKHNNQNKNFAICTLAGLISRAEHNDNVYWFNSWFVVICIFMFPVASILFFTVAWRYYRHEWTDDDFNAHFSVRCQITERNTSMNIKPNIPNIQWIIQRFSLHVVFKSV